MPFVEGDSYTTDDRVQALAGRDDAFSATTFPTDQDVLDRMALRAAEITAAMGRNGLTATVSTGATPLSWISGALVATLVGLCDTANAYGAAADVIALRAVGGGGGPELLSVYLKEYDRLIVEIEETAARAIMEQESSSVPGESFETSTDDLPFSMDDPIW